MQRIGNMDTHQRTREKDSRRNDNGPTHHTNEKKIQQDCETKKTRPTKKKYTNDLSSTGDECEDGQSSNTLKDQDSDVSFENDTEEENLYYSDRRRL